VKSSRIPTTNSLNWKPPVCLLLRNVLENPKKSLDKGEPRIKQLERLKAFFRAAHIRRWIAENPGVAMRGPKINLRPTLPFSREEMTSIMAGIDRYPDKRAATSCVRPRHALFGFAHRRCNLTPTGKTEREQAFSLYAENGCPRLRCASRVRGRSSSNCPSVERAIFFLDRQVDVTRGDRHLATNADELVRVGRSNRWSCSSVPRQVRHGIAVDRRAA
jgi:hypothetical protein